MRRAPVSLVLASTLLLAACSAGDAVPDGGPALPPADVCDEVGATEVPVECIPDAEGGRPLPSTSPPPGGSGAFPALQIESIEGELARADNNDDPRREMQTLTVTVPRGSRLGVQAACEGYSTVIVTTDPDSQAAFEFDCGFEGQPAEIGVETSEPVMTDTIFRITVDVPAPARWAAVAYATDEPLINDGV